MSQTIYFDNAATTPLSEQVLEEMMPYLKEFLRKSIQCI